MVNALLLEDTPDHNKTYTWVLTHDRHTVKSVFSGEEGLEALLLDEKFDIIFTDYNMDELTGYDFSKSVKTDPKYIKHSNIPIIGIGDFPENKREYLVACTSKGTLKLTDFDKWITQYCK